MIPSGIGKQISRIKLKEIDVLKRNPQYFMKGGRTNNGHGSLHKSMGMRLRLI